MKLRALVDLSLRKSGDPLSPEWAEWHNWPAGTVFDAPEHMRTDLALKRGIAEKAPK